jgi:hypothetical protein
LELIDAGALTFKILGSVRLVEPGTNLMQVVTRSSWDGRGALGVLGRLGQTALSQHASAAAQFRFPWQLL